LGPCLRETRGRNADQYTRETRWISTLVSRGVLTSRAHHVPWGESRSGALWSQEWRYRQRPDRDRSDTVAPTGPCRCVGVVVRKKTLPPRIPLVYIHCPVTVPRSLRSVRGLAVWRGTPLARVRLRGSNTRRPQDLRFLPAQHEVSAHASCERSQTAAPSRLPTRSSGRVCVPKQACALARLVPLFLRPLISSLCEAWAVRPLASFLLARPLRHVGRLCRGPLEQHSACRFDG
jgi:hypothetical protein